MYVSWQNLSSLPYTIETLEDLFCGIVQKLGSCVYQRNPMLNTAKSNEPTQRKVQPTIS